MADSPNYLEKGVVYAKNTLQSFRAQASAAISPNLLLAMDTSGEVAAAAALSDRVVGASGDDSIANNDPVDILFGAPVRLTADGGGVVAGRILKAGHAGKATLLIDSTLAGSGLDTSSVGLAFTNQPANDGIEIVSDNAGDTTQSITIYGTTNGADTVVAETVALNGVVAVSTVKVDWGVVLGVLLSASCAGTVTVREASANATIVTLATTVLSKGLDAVTGGSVGTYNIAPIVTADGATTKQIGLIGTSYVGTTIYDSQALNGATAVTMNTAFQTVTYILTGDLEATRTVTLGLGAEEDDDLAVGRALENQTVAGDTFFAYVHP